MWKATIRIWKDDSLCFAMASYLVKSFMAGEAENVTNESVALGKNIGKLYISSRCRLILTKFHKMLHKEIP